MIQGKNINEVAGAVLAERNRVRDYVTDCSNMRMRSRGVSNDELVVDLRMSTDSPVGKYVRVEPSDRFHAQMSNHLKIPKRYYDRMRSEAPRLLVENVNEWLDSQGGDRRLIRTFDNDFESTGSHHTGRAFLSDRYRRLDNYDLMEKLMPIASESGLHVRSAELTERRLYLQLVTPSIEGEVVKGDTVQAGIVVSNSEVGSGSLSIQRLIYRLVCTNGMISSRNDGNFRRTHIGKSLDDGDQSSIFSDETLKATDTAFWMQAADAMRAALDSDLFRAEVDDLRRLAGVEIPSWGSAVEDVTQRFELTDNESDSIMNHLVNGGDLSQWGMVNAITRTAEDSLSYDRAIELETFGGDYAANPEGN
tara:strand:- start:11692 stop:12780 length:1089 start_codon:yes stop_codon:yes gene_type:complete